MSVTKLKYSEVVVVEPNSVKYFIVMEKDPDCDLDDPYGNRWRFCYMERDYKEAEGWIKTLSDSNKKENERHKGKKMVFRKKLPV